MNIKWLYLSKEQESSLWITGIYLCLLSSFCYLAFPVDNLEGISQGILITASGIQIFFTNPLGVFPLFFPVLTLFLEIILPYRAWLKLFYGLADTMLGAWCIKMVAEKAFPWVISKEAVFFYTIFMLVSVITFFLTSVSHRKRMYEELEREDFEDA